MKMSRSTFPTFLNFAQYFSVSATFKDVYSTGAKLPRLALPKTEFFNGLRKITPRDFQFGSPGYAKLVDYKDWMNWQTVDVIPSAS